MWPVCCPFNITAEQNNKPEKHYITVPVTNVINRGFMGSEVMD